MPIGPTSGFLDFTNATPRADVIVALSNIGIGTDAPLHALDLRGTANVADIIINNDLTLTGGLTTNSLTINSMSMSTTSNFQQVTNVGNVTTNTVEFTNPTTGLAVTSNAEVGGELSVSGNVEVGTANLFVDTTTGNVGVGTTEPTESLDIVGNLNLQKVSNTASIKLNSNVVTEYTRSKKLIKYPRVAMTQNALNNGYAAEASTENNGTSSGQAYRLFDGIAGGDRGYHSVGATYTSGSTYNGSASITDAYGTQHQGEWIKLQMPTADKIKLSGFSFSPRYVSTAEYHHRAPYKGVFLGSTDGTNWYPIHYFDKFAVPELTTVSRTFENTTNDYYNRIALVAYEVGPNATYGDVLNFAEMELFGVPEYDPEAHGTDVIARSVPNVPNTDWLEVYYDANDSSNYTLSGSDVTGVSDLSTNSRDCTASGVTIDSTWNAFRFDGSTSEIKVEDFTISGGDFIHTISLWLNMDEVAGKIFYFSADVSSGSAAADSVSGLTFDGSGYLRWYHVANDTSYDIKPDPNKWYHVGLVYPGGSSNYQTVYVNGQSIPPLNNGNSSNSINLPTTIDLFLGRGRTASLSRMKGMIANFRIQNRALTSDEIWQLYAYQKEYFDVSPDVVTFKGGRLGIGTSEPRAVLDVRGDFHAHGSVVQFQNRTFGLSFSTTSTTFTDTGAYVDITPKFSNSKFFVMFDGLAYIGTNLANGLGIRAYRSIGGGADQLVYAASQYEGATGSPHDLALYLDPANYIHGRIPISFGDTPNTSSSITYKIYARAHVSGRNARLGNSGHQPVTFSVFEIAQ